VSLSYLLANGEHLIQSELIFFVFVVLEFIVLLGLGLGLIISALTVVKLPLLR
jgi:hypothetical protein